jgi:hypothetical protein
MVDYTPRDWLVVFGLAMLLLSWWVSFRMVRVRPPAVDLGPPGLN